MSNDWNDDSASGTPAGPEQPGMGPGPGGPSGPGFDDDGNPLTDGWGEGNLDLDEMKGSFRMVWENLRGPILKAWIGLALLIVGYQVLAGIVNIAIYYSGVSALSFVSTLLGWIGAPLATLVAAGQISLYRPLSGEIFEGKGTAATTPREALESASKVFVMVLITVFIYTFAAGIGTALCLIPGIAVIFFLGMGPYLAATREELNPIEAFHESFNLAKKHWTVMLFAVVGLFVGSSVAGVGYGLLAVAMGCISSIGQPFTTVISGVVLYLLLQVGVFVAYLLWATVFVTIDRREQTR